VLRLIREGIAELVNRRDLRPDQCAQIMREILSGEATPSQVGAFMVAMRMKGETSDEVVGFASVMRDTCRRIDAPPGSIDLCGTGGDGMGTFNISTTASFVVASLGVPVAKHGNRSISSLSGSADVLKALRLPVERGPEEVRQCIFGTGIGFMLAPIFHPSMAKVAAPRKEVGIRSLFNMLGPLCNPAGVKHQLLGVYDPHIAPLFASALGKMGGKRAIVVHGEGMDEITTLGSTEVVELKEGEIERYRLHPSMFGMDEAEEGELKGGDPHENARIMLSVLRGERSARGDIVALNAGAALYVAGRSDSIEEGVLLARQAIESGRAMAKLEEFKGFLMRLEEKRQMFLTAEEVVDHSLLPSTLTRRSAPLTDCLLEKLRRIDGSEDYIGAIDRDVIARPSALTVIALRRALRLLSDREKDLTPLEPVGGLSESIARRNALSIIGEVKPSSPTSMDVAMNSPEMLVEAYSSAGFVGISVLTEPDFFFGSTSIFRRLRPRVGLPMLWKDFIIHPSQLHTAAVSGADAVLIIAKLLAPEPLAELTRQAIDCGLEPLLEVHDLDDMGKAERSGALGMTRLVGINSRDLGDLSVDIGRAIGLRDLVPDGLLCIAESGVVSSADLAVLQRFDAVLVGSMFSSARSPKMLASELLAAARGGGG